MITFLVVAFVVVGVVVVVVGLGVGVVFFLVVFLRGVVGGRVLVVLGVGVGARKIQGMFFYKFIQSCTFRGLFKQYRT